MRRSIALLVCVLLVFGGGTGAALADGDPASDVLLGQDVYYPYSPAVSAPLQGKLNAMTAAARKSGFPVKVAIIAQPPDLGVIPDLFNRAQKYADFLVQEISFQGKQKLLVVMPAGFGTAGLPPVAATAVAAAPKPAGSTSDDLAKAAITALSRAATAAGHPISGAGGTPSGDSGGGTAVLVAILAAVALSAIAGLVVLRRRRTPTP